jgi:DNA ligase (NAD+)
MEKYDGISIVLYYVDGILKHAVTRGDGLVGEDICRNVKKIPNVKEIIEGFNGVLKGEIILPKSHFENVNKESNNKFSNPRNAASGIVREFAGEYCHYLKVKYFDIDDGPYAKQYDRIQRMRELLPDEEFPHELLSEVSEIDYIYTTYIEKFRNGLDYNIDGLVITLNNMHEASKVGSLHGRPKWKIALKFPAEEYTTMLEDVLWSTTRTGRVNPKAKVSTINIDGVNVEYATLHNYKYVEDMNLHKGDMVSIRRSGDVIPQIIDVKTPIKGDTKFEIPVNCPECGKELRRDDKYLYCTNLNCRAIELGSLQHYVSTLGVDLVGDKFIEKLYDAGYTEIEDLYRIAHDWNNEEDLTDIDGIGEKKVDIFQRELRRVSENIPMWKFLVALNIDHLGKQNAIKYVNGEKLGEETMKKINHILIYKLARYLKLENSGYITFKVEKTLDTSETLTFCITGKLSRPRKEYEQMLEERGYALSSSVTQNTDYLVTNTPESGSSKNKAAKKYGTKIITEEEFVKELLTD